MDKTKEVIYHLTVTSTWDPDFTLLDELYRVPRNAAVYVSSYVKEHFHTQVSVRDILQHPDLRNGARFGDLSLIIKIRERILK